MLFDDDQLPNYMPICYKDGNPPSSSSSMDEDTDLCVPACSGVVEEGEQESEFGGTPRRTTELRQKNPNQQKASFWSMDEEEAALRTECSKRLKAQSNQEQTAPIQLPTPVYTRSGGIRWEANLEFADDRYGEMYVPSGQRAMYVLRITGAVRESDGARLRSSQLPDHLQYLVNEEKNYVIAFPTCAINLIKGVGVNCTESGWDAWRLACNDQSIRVQKRCRLKRDPSIVKYLGGGFLNPTSRTPEQVAEYLQRHPSLAVATDHPNTSTEAATASATAALTDLPPLTHEELRDWWWNRCDERGSAGRVVKDKQQQKKGRAEHKSSKPKNTKTSRPTNNTSLPKRSPENS